MFPNTMAHGDNAFLSDYPNMTFARSLTGEYYTAGFVEVEEPG